mgnify:CR=1 FL=1
MPPPTITTGTFTRSFTLPATVDAVVLRQRGERLRAHMLEDYAWPKQGERLARFRRSGVAWPTPYEDYDRYLNTVRYVDEFIGDAILAIFGAPVTREDDEKSKLKKLLNMSVNEIELSVRAANCLNNANITTVGQLAMKTEQEMLKYRNFGKKSLNEIKDKLAALGLTDHQRIAVEIEVIEA